MRSRIRIGKRIQFVSARCVWDTFMIRSPIRIQIGIKYVLVRYAVHVHSTHGDAGCTRWQAQQPNHRQPQPDQHKKNTSRPSHTNLELERNQHNSEISNNHNQIDTRRSASTRQRRINKAEGGSTPTVQLSYRNT